MSEELLKRVLSSKNYLFATRNNHNESQKRARDREKLRIAKESAFSATRLAEAKSVNWIRTFRPIRLLASIVQLST